MGNFHCVPSSCAKVVYRKYLPLAVRYRYSDEDWIYVDGDDYAIEQKDLSGGEPWVVYDVTIDIKIHNYQGTSYLINEIRTYRVRGPIEGIKWYPGKHYADGRKWAVHLICYGYPNQPRYYPQLVRSAYTTNRNESAPRSIDKVDITNIVRVDGTDDDSINRSCTFTVYKNQQVVHTETRIGCPEVEKLDCRLSDERKIIEVDKIPFLERVEVVPWAYQNFIGVLNPNDSGFLVGRYPIPDECLCVYKNTTVTIIPQTGGGFTPTNSAQANYGIIQQICSAPGCPPPEYNVECNCDDCEKCPPNTCPIECENVVCCYDTNTGRAVKTIEVDNYCGGT